MGGVISRVINEQSIALTKIYKDMLEKKGCAVSISTGTKEYDDDIGDDHFQVLEFSDSKGNKGQYEIAFSNSVDWMGGETPWAFSVKRNGDFNPLEGETISVPTAG